MATLENFDSYSTGDLNGQGSWSAPAEVDVTAAVAQSGSNSVTRTGSGGISDSTKSITAVTVDGDQISFYVRGSVVNDAGGGSFGAFFSSGATKLFTCQLNQDNHTITINGATAQTLTSSLSVDTWYQITIEFDFANDRARAKVDAGAFSSYVSAVGSAAFSQVDVVGLSFGGTTGNVYVDTFEVTTVAPTFVPLIMMF